MRDTGYFSPGSMIRRIWRESIVMLGGGQRMLLIEAAHPLVAAAIVQHSSFRDDPWTRLGRTVTAYSTVIFADRAEADRVAKRVRSRHREIQGYAVGMPYSASDPQLLMWVHSSAVDTGLVMFETFIRPLEEVEREAFYAEMKLVARLFGTPSKVVPATLEGFRDYQRERLESGEIVVGLDAREIAELVLRPSVPLGMRPALAALSAVTIALLPLAVREQYGFRCGLELRGLAAASRHVVRRALPLLPERARLLWPTHETAGPSGLVLDAILAFATRRADSPQAYNVPLSVTE